MTQTPINVDDPINNEGLDPYHQAQDSFEQEAANFYEAEEAEAIENEELKIQQIEENTQLSSSLVGVTNAEIDLLNYDNNISEIKNNFDHYETYLYNVTSSYKSSSMGEFPNASWPKTGSGTYYDPYTPVSSSNS